MARMGVKIDGTAKYSGALSDISTLIKGFETDIPDEVVCEMLDAEAKVIEDEQRKNAETMLNERGKSKGMTAKAIKRYAAKRNKDGISAIIGFAGERADAPKAHRANTKQTERRAAEVAFINEYGSIKTPARAFIKKAIDAKADEGYSKAEAIFDEWQKRS